MVSIDLTRFAALSRPLHEVERARLLGRGEVIPRNCRAIRAPGLGRERR
jgi:hypothetical protein